MCMASKELRKPHNHHRQGAFNWTRRRYQASIKAFTLKTWQSTAKTLTETDTETDTETEAETEA